VASVAAAGDITTATLGPLTAKEACACSKVCGDSTPDFIRFRARAAAAKRTSEEPASSIEGCWVDSNIMEDKMLK